MKFHLERMNNMVKNIRYISAFLLIIMYHSKSKQPATSGTDGSIAAGK